MNFFGHAILAVRHCADPAFVLGAMLADFATMIRARPPLTEHAAIDLGMRFHWRTDDAFHRSLTFGNLTHAAVTRLSTRGVRSGSALAAAHVGVEILLDAALARDAPGQQAYLAALNGAAPRELGRHVTWASDEQIMRFDRLRERLLERGPIVSDIAPEVAAGRRRRALADRPRLALDDAAIAGRPRLGQRGARSDLGLRRPTSSRARHPARSSSRDLT